MVSNIEHTSSIICTQLNGFNYFYVTQTIQFNISHLFVHIWIGKQSYLILRWDPYMDYRSGLDWTWE